MPNLTCGNARPCDARSSNYATAVAPNLVSCSSWLATFQSQINAGQRLILPARCDITENSWSGAGYLTINSTGTNIGAIIGGGLAGRFPSKTLPAPETVSNALTNSVSQEGSLKQFLGEAWNDPIDITKGHFLYAHEDMNICVGAFPLGLSLQRRYSSGLRTQDGPLVQKALLFQQP